MMAPVGLLSPNEDISILLKVLLVLVVVVKYSPSSHKS